MSDSKSLVQAIRAEEKHKGHSGGLNGCPLCSRKAEEADPFDLLVEEEGEAAPAQAEGSADDIDPIKARLQRLLP